MILADLYDAAYYARLEDDINLATELERQIEVLETVDTDALEDAYYNDLYRSLERGEVCHI